MEIKREYNGRVFVDYISDIKEGIPKSEEIERLKSKLQESDYKITKIAEAMAIGAELPYDAQALHKERQTLRDKINELESEVQNG